MQSFGSGRRQGSRDEADEWKRMAAELFVAARWGEFSLHEEAVISYQEKEVDGG